MSSALVWKMFVRDKSFLRLALAGALLLTASLELMAQNPAPSADSPKKANARPVAPKPAQSDPFEGVPIEKLFQCVSLQTEQGQIIIQMLPEKAPETVRAFLNLVATGGLDTTVFSRIIKGFVIQGGNLSTSEKWSAALSARMARTIKDEPNDVNHVRGVVSMARSDEPHSASTHFFILVGPGPHLDGKFSAFGRVIRGIEVADGINRAETNGDTPLVPVRINLATVSACDKQ
jgi:peptidyl-prolyl cis-trans isomerase B (cyclophilin B)